MVHVPHPHSFDSFDSSHHLYVSDMDGTLLGENSILSPSARKILVEVITRQRKPFTVASARSITTISEILKDLPLVLPVIQLNGALVTDYHSREDFHQVLLQEKEVLTLLDIFRDFEACFLSSAKESHDNTNRCLMPAKRNAAMEWFYQDRIQKRDPRIVVVPDNDYIKDYRPISFTVIESHDRSSQIFEIIDQELKDHLEIYPMGVDDRGWEWITLQSKEANKGRAVEKLCEIFNFAPERVTVFGDNVNDISMFNKKFRGVAVENAHQLIKSKADNIIGNHRDDSVARYVHAE